MNIFNPLTIEEAIRYLSEKNGKVLAGGTDLLLHLKHPSDSAPSHLVSLRKIPDLKKLLVEKALGSDGNLSELVIGSNVTFTEIIENKYIKDSFTSLWDAALSVGSVQIRNIATVGGNICNSSPAADTVPVLFSLGARCVLISTRGTRVLPIQEILLGKGKNALEADELLTEIRVPIPTNNYRTAFSKLGKRNALAISRASMSMYLVFDEEERIHFARISTGSLGTTTNFEAGGENYLLGKKLTEVSGEELCAVISAEVGERLGNRSTAPYKREAIKGLVHECLFKVLGDFSKGGMK